MSSKYGHDVCVVEYWCIYKYKYILLVHSTHMLYIRLMPFADQHRRFRVDSWHYVRSFATLQTYGLVLSLYVYGLFMRAHINVKCKRKREKRKLKKQKKKWEFNKQQSN